MRADVFTLFPEWFDWFGSQRHARNVFERGTELRFFNYRDTTPLGGGQVDDAPYGGGAGMVLRVQIDRPGPAATADESVSVEDCAHVSRDLSALLDVEDVVPTAYTLEVSSPGLDRPLRGRGDFDRFTGRRAKVVMREPVDGQTFFKGRLAGVEADAVLIDSDDGRRHRVPVGIVQASWGGTHAEAWTRVTALPETLRAAPPAKEERHRPGHLWNGMLAPLVGYKFKLAAWYQGESNTGAGAEYRALLPLLMRDWRRAFGQADLPFLIVQLPGYGAAPKAPGKSGWAELREAELLQKHYVEGKTLLDAGAELGLSKSWASRLHARAIDQLRTILVPDDTS